MNKIFIASDDEVPEALRILEGEEVLSCDTETAGLDPHTCPLWCVQLGTKKDSMLFPWNALNEESRDLLRQFTAGKTLIAHNAKFDSKFLIKNGFVVDKVYCTHEAERTLYAGKYFTFSLKDLLFRRFQIQMSKEARTQFYDGTFARLIEEHGDWGAWTEELVEYALEDIVYLHEIFEQQTEEARELGISNVHWLEMVLVPVVARMENRGVYLDKEATKKFQDKVMIRKDELSQELFGRLEKSFNIAWQKEYKDRMTLWESWQKGHREIVAKTSSMRSTEDKRKKSPEALKMVEESNKNKPFSSPPKPDNPFSPSSSQKLCMALSQHTGLPITTTSKEWLEENIHLDEAIADLVEFRKFDKLVQFCELVNNINKVTNRIHANFKQNGTKSGRFSCEDPNLQQIPARSEEAREFRALFRAPDGYKLVGADLAGIELVILAYFSGEEGLLEAINTGKDVHCFTMSLLLGAPYEALVALKKGKDVEDPSLLQKFLEAKKRFEQKFSLPDLVKLTNLTDWVNKLRDYTKTLTYGLAYGMSPFGLSRKFHCSYEDAEAFLALFFSGYGKLKVFLAKQEEMGFQRGYAVNPLGRRRWFQVPYRKKYDTIENEVIKALDKSGRLWDSVTDEEWHCLMEEAVKEANKDFNRRVNGIKRQAGNFFPQSMCADMVKLAMYLVDKDFEGADDSEGLILTVHDELIMCVREDNTEHASEVLKASMERAVLKFMPEVHVDTTVNVSDVWTK